jgi:hypothetical protein
MVLLDHQCNHFEGKNLSVEDPPSTSQYILVFVMYNNFCRVSKIFPLRVGVKKFSLFVNCTSNIIHFWCSLIVYVHILHKHAYATLASRVPNI